MPGVHFQFGRIDPRQHFGDFSRRMYGEPGWIWRAAITAALIVLLVPILALIIAAGLAFAFVFVVLALGYRVGSWFSGLFNRRGAMTSHDDVGRRNVRVIYHEE